MNLVLAAHIFELSNVAIIYRTIGKFSAVSSVCNMASKSVNYDTLYKKFRGVNEEIVIHATKKIKSNSLLN